MQLIRKIVKKKKDIIVTFEKIKIKGCLKVLYCLFLKIFFGCKYIKINFFIFKNLFLTSTHQNNMKTPKKNLKYGKKINHELK